MKERPILMNTEMVKAILEGRKTQTRRVIKPIPQWVYEAGKAFDSNKNPYLQMGLNDDSGASWSKKCHYGKVGDRLWVRETFAEYFSIHTPDDPDYLYKASDYSSDDYRLKDIKWTPSIFMPKHACRLKLEITDIRVERVQEISPEDAVKEGIKVVSHPSAIQELWGIENLNYMCPMPDEAFSYLWNSINGKKEDCSWDNNPYVWVIEFKRI